MLEARRPGLQALPVKITSQDYQSSKITSQDYKDYTITSLRLQVQDYKNTSQDYEHT